jgi:cytochrome d ubiquinol oxidase subunit II
LNPFALLTGVVSLSMLVMHGAVYIQLRTEGAVYQRAKVAARIFGLLMIAAFAAAGVWLAMGIDGFRIISMPAASTSPNVLAKVVEQAGGAWMNNYTLYPWMMAAPALGFAGALLALLLSAKDRPGTAFVFSGIALAGVILTAGFSLFPFIMPSSLDPRSSLTVWDATSSHLTLTLMFWAVVIFLPIIILYTSWVYSVMRGKVTEARIREESHSMY